MRRMIRGGGLALALALAIGSQALAQDRTPAQLLGGALLLIVVAEVCDIPADPAQRQALAAAGERLQARVGLSDEEIERMAVELGKDATDGVDCAKARAGYAAEAEAVIAEAGRIP